MIFIKKENANLICLKGSESIHIYLINKFLSYRDYWLFKKHSTFFSQNRSEKIYWTNIRHSFCVWWLVLKITDSICISYSSKWGNNKTADLLSCFLDFHRNLIYFLNFSWISLIKTLLLHLFARIFVSYIKLAKKFFSIRMFPLLGLQH